MRLGEAYLDKSNLEDQLDLLKSRLTNDLKVGLDTRPLVEELQRKANLLRDISIAIAWTEQNTLLSGVPLGMYKKSIESLRRLADIVEPANRERADSYRNNAHHDLKFIEAAVWLVDLQIPKVEETKKPDKED